jgi:hypothetical protein
MTISEQDLADFNQFAVQKLASGDAKSIERLGREWTEARQLSELVDNIAQSEADIEAGRVKPLDDAFANIWTVIH